MTTSAIGRVKWSSTIIKQIFGTPNHISQSIKYCCLSSFKLGKLWKQKLDQSRPKFTSYPGCLLLLHKNQKTKFSSSAPIGCNLSPISRIAAAVESSMPSKYCKRDNFSGAGSLLKYTEYRSASSSDTSHDKGFDGTALSHARRSLRDDT